MLKVSLDIVKVYLYILRGSIDTAEDCHDTVTSSQDVFICSRDMLTGPQDIANAP
jgi:hypothetical protein